MHAQFTPALRAFFGGVRFSFSTIDGNVALPQTHARALLLVLILFKSPRFPCKKVYIIVRFDPRITLLTQRKQEGI